MATAQLNVRIDEDLKRAGDAVLDRFGISTVQIVREVWQYMSEHQKPPALGMPGEDALPARSVNAPYTAKAGMALRMAREAGIRVQLESMTYKELRESAYEEALLEEAEHRA